jgi:hypothetical protein
MVDPMPPAMQSIQVDQEVIDFILKNKRDYRVSTSCSGPVIVPVEVKAPKETDLRVKVGEHTLYISRVQARYIDRVTSDMLDESRYQNCSVF